MEDEPKKSIKKRLGRAVILWLRIVLWVIPWVVLGAVSFGKKPYEDETRNLLFGIVIVICGLVDAILRAEMTEWNGGAFVVWLILFIVIEVLLAPLVLYLFLFGACLRYGGYGT